MNLKKRLVMPIPPTMYYEQVTLPGNRLFFIVVSSQPHPARKLQLRPVSVLGKLTRSLAPPFRFLAAVRRLLN